MGAGTHLDTHTAAICDARGRVVSQLQIPATTAGYVQAAGLGPPGSRDPRSGLGGGRHPALRAGPGPLPDHPGEQVSEIDCSRHIGKRRAGKSDPIDAVRAARELLAHPAPAQMRADGDREALRLLMTGRDNAVQSAKTARTALAAVLVTAPASLRGNGAIHTIAVTRMRCHQPTQAYAQRRRAEGKTDREIRRCIKRYLARHLYRTLNNGSLSNT